ncbi:MAG TPA: hypothetical protein VND45_03440 [Thermoanaerobaculia bacterium]|jgi:hypothetical protein|nr:hypothetical protein [Thermoanaerobaculia bacterium]
MNTKSDWQAVHAQLLAERRRKLGDPPTVEEMMAYTRGELSRDEEERVRALLVSYPELLRAVTAEVPDDDAVPGDPYHLPDDVVSRQWNAFQERVRPDRTPEVGRVLPFWRASTAIAAALALTFGVLLWRAQARLDDPRVATVATHTLQPDGQRGGEQVPPTLHASQADLFLLEILVLTEEEFPRYRIDITADGAARPMWSNTTTRPDGETFTVVLQRTSLRPGTYKAAVYGIDGARSEPLATYAFRVR